jgi:cAMP-binding proteins - catabolite gene activator and regulatory subunit of cAMP-dependent protein kinases
MSLNSINADFDKGEIIIKQGAFSLNIVYLRTGLVKVHINGLTAKDHILKFVKAPAYIGLPTSIGDKINQFSVTAIEDSSVCFIDQKCFDDLLHANENFSYEIIVGLCKDELQCFKYSLYRTQKHVRGLMAEMLLYFSREIYLSETFNCPLSRYEAADFIGTSRETVSRILSEFEKEKIIKIDGKQRIILDFERLDSICKNG